MKVFLLDEAVAVNSSGSKPQINKKGSNLSLFCCLKKRAYQFG
jgi:hypothetical protein